MYNIYIEEKKKEQERQKQVEERKMNSIMERQKKIQTSLISNYDSRVKDFIIEMAIAKNAVCHKECQKPILNTRLKYLEENKGKIKGRSGFLYRGYKNEKERINDAIQYNKVLFASIQVDEPKQNKSPNANSYSKMDNPQYCQPHLKFKARTDLERIKEGVNLNYYGKVESEIIKNQLLAIKNKTKKRFNSVNTSKLNPSSEEREIEKENEHIIPPTPKKKTLLPKNYIHIIPKAVFFKTRGYKTHFKATESIALRENKLFESLFNNKRSSSVFTHHQNSINNSNNDDHSNQNVFDFEDKNNNAYFRTKQLLYSQSQENIFNLNRNPNKKRDLFPDNKADLSLLRQIAFTQREKEEMPNIKHQQQPYHDDLTRFEKKITIGNEEYGIQSQINIIAEKVLNKCNIYPKKNNSNSSFHEANTGKLMMTSGLSIKDFLIKYNLPG